MFPTLLVDVAPTDCKTGKLTVLLQFVKLIRLIRSLIFKEQYFRLLSIHTILTRKKQRFKFFHVKKKKQFVDLIPPIG